MDDACANCGRALRKHFFVDFNGSDKLYCSKSCAQGKPHDPRIAWKRPNRGGEGKLTAYGKAKLKPRQRD